MEIEVYDGSIHIQSGGKLNLKRSKIKHLKNQQGKQVNRKKSHGYKDFE